MYILLRNAIAKIGQEVCLFVCNLFSDAFSETQNYVVSNECMMSE
jgi:hypothetical protein